jgi:hypothetical protein
MRREAGITEVTLEQAARFILARHHLVQRVKADPARMVGDLCGVHAQVSSTALLSLWARVEGFTLERLHAALYGRPRLVKVWCMRWRLHLVPVAEFAVYLYGVMRARRAARRRWLAREKRTLAPDQERRIQRQILDALAERPLTRKELHRAVPALRSVRSAAWGLDVGDLVYQGLVVHAEPHGAEVRFARVDRWLPKMRLGSLDENQARQRLLRRYLAAYGPASVADFAYWTGLTVAEVRPAFAALGDELAEVSIVGLKGNFWVHRADVRALRETDATAPTPVRLLPSFDPLLLGHKDKTRFVDEARRSLVFRKAGWLSPVVLVDGRVNGTWRYERRGKRLAVKLAPWSRWRDEVWTAIGQEVEHLGRTLGVAQVEMLSDVSRRLA